MISAKERISKFLDNVLKNTIISSSKGVKIFNEFMDMLDEYSEECFDSGHVDGYQRCLNENNYEDDEDRISEAYEEGKETGYNDGYDDGYENGYSQGRDDGYEEGKETGYNDGYDDGYDVGYTEGYNNGLIDNE